MSMYFAIFYGNLFISPRNPVATCSYYTFHFGTLLTLHLDTVSKLYYWITIFHSIDNFHQAPIRTSWLCKIFGVTFSFTQVWAHETNGETPSSPHFLARPSIAPRLVGRPPQAWLGSQALQHPLPGVTQLHCEPLHGLCQLLDSAMDRSGIAPGHHHGCCRGQHNYWVQLQTCPVWLQASTATTRSGAAPGLSCRHPRTCRR